MSSLKFKLNQTTQKSVFLAFSMILALTTQTFAGGSLSTGIDAGTAEVTGTLSSVINLVMAIGGVVAIIGAVTIYQKWNTGERDINKELLSWGGSAVFLIAAPIIARAVFGL
ncbi:MAG TPA: DUF4134 domain-containing protein [Sphingobacterium sp.]|nr:DUF4134 domain-containing protein [Sphingobacterium sp.]